MGVGCCQITPSALSAPSAPITKAHTNSTRFNKKSFVEICANLWQSVVYGGDNLFVKFV